MPDWGQIRADFLRAEVETGNVFAEIALSADDERKRIRNTKNALVAYTTALRFMSRAGLRDAQAITETLESLSLKLVVLGEMGESVLGRRLEDRIRKLAAIAERVPIGSPAHQKITERIKADLSEYFEREKNPLYDTDRRAPTQS